MEGCYIAGADPELMVVSPSGSLVSAIDIGIPGTKKRPKRVSRGAIQRDNVMAEFNVAPSRTSEEFEENIRSVLRSLNRVVRPYRLAVRASACFPEEALASNEARIFGCDPDFNAWTLTMNSIDGFAAEGSFRSAGGHFHVGGKESTSKVLDDPYGKVEIVKMMDIFMGVPSVIIDPDPTAPARRSLYGGAGAHRPKEYGVEYRALGNFWVASPSLVRLMYELADLVVRLTQEGESEDIVNLAKPSRVIDAINNSNMRKAHNVVQSVKKYLPKHILTQLEEKPEGDLYSNWGI